MTQEQPPDLLTISVDELVASVHHMVACARDATCSDSDVAQAEAAFCLALSSWVEQVMSKATGQSASVSLHFYNIFTARLDAMTQRLAALEDMVEGGP